MVTFHPKRHSGKLWKIISKSLHFLSYVGLYLFGKKLKEIILNAHKPKKRSEQHIANSTNTPFKLGVLIRSTDHSSCHHSVVKRFFVGTIFEGGGGVTSMT